MHFKNEILSGEETPGVSIAVCPCLDSRNQISLRIQNLEAPSFSRTVYRIFSDTQISVMGIAKGHSCSLSRRDIDRFHRGVTDPVRVIHFNFLCIQRPNRQIGNRYASVGPGGKGRTRNRLCAGGIGVKTDLPTIQILACVCFLDQLNAAGVKPVVEINRCSSPCGDGYFLRIGAVAGIQSSNTRVRMA